MAELGLRQLQKFGLAYLAMTRKDGSPRVNPVCPVIADGRVYVATSQTSPKRLDLLRDGRYVLHMLPGKQEEEFWIRGVARRVTDNATRARVVETAAQRAEPYGGPLRIKPRRVAVRVRRRRDRHNHLARLLHAGPPPAPPALAQPPVGLVIPSGKPGGAGRQRGISRHCQRDIAMPIDGSAPLKTFR